MQGLEKSTLRKHFLRLRATHPPDQALADSAQIRTKLLELHEVRAARSILLYLAARGEVDTWPLLDLFLAEKRLVLAPCCVAEKPGHMLIRQISSRDDLTPGAFGLMEPRSDTPIYGAPPQIILVPGLAFDRRGFRLGFGGGYYDRFLAAAGQEALSIGLAYDFQITDALPTNPWDRAVHLVLTPKSTIAGQIREGS